MLNIVLYRPEICPNTGNIIRLCYALGAKLHIIKPIPFDLHPKWLKRPSAGKYLSDIEHEVHESYDLFAKKYNQKNIYYVTRYGQKLYSDINYKSHQSQDIFLMYGRESTGIPLKILKQNFQKCIRIPMTSNSRSLNLANSVAITAFELKRQNNFKNLSPFEVQKGKDWILRGTTNEK